MAGFFNKFMELGKFPDLLKIGKIIPIYKKRDPKILDNYRPVSVITIFGKIFEKVIYSFFHSMNVVYDKQSGFRNKITQPHMQ